MKKITKNLVVGDVMQSGEVVKSVRKGGRTSPKAHVTLIGKAGKIRTASWNWYGTVFLKNEVSAACGQPLEDTSECCGAAIEDERRICTSCNEWC